MGSPLDDCQADMDRLNATLLKLEAEEKVASDLIEQIEDEEPDTPEQAADQRTRLEAAELAHTELREQIDDAQGDWNRAQAIWLNNGEDPHDDEEALDVDDAAEIWGSKGMDSAYMFGYTEDELRRALGA